MLLAPTKHDRPGGLGPAQGKPITAVRSAVWPNGTPIAGGYRHPRKFFQKLKGQSK